MKAYTYTKHIQSLNFEMYNLVSRLFRHICYKMTSLVF